jgi:TonB family protein
MIGKEKQEAASNIGDNYEAALLNYFDKEAAAVPPSPEKKKQSDELDALMSDLLKQVMTESDQPKPDLEATKAESLHLAVGTQKPKADILKPEMESSAVLGPPREEAAPAEASSIAPASKPAAAIFAAPAARKSKIPFIAIACFCALAAVGIPIYIFTGSASHASKPVESQHADAASSPIAASKAAPDGRVSAVAITKVLPKYPNLGVKGGVSGSVVLELSIDSNGTVVNAAPVSGNPLFYNEAINAANQWRFRPASVAGANVPSRSRVTLYFRPGN